MPIKKIIYYTWVSDKPFPEKYRHFIDGWKKLMPDYEIIELNIDNYPHNPWTDAAVAQKKFILAGHYARCQRIYETGGFYCDIDIEAIKSFDELLNDSMCVGCECDDVVNNAIFGCEKGHWFMKECMEYMDKYPLDSPNIELETGPRMFTNIMKKHGFNGKNTNQKVLDVSIYNNKYFYPYFYTEKYYPECIKPETIAIHHWGNTWGKDNYIDKDLVSIIIPCYKQAEYLTDAIESALNQTYKNVEVIVVNDGSPDNTSEIAKKYPVKLIEHENHGLSYSRNAGIKASHGKWILTLDADDKIDPTFIEKTINKADIVSTTLLTFGKEERCWQAPRDNPKHEHFLVDNQINCCSLFRREIFDKIGGFDENMHDGYEDWDFWIRATKFGYSVKVIREPLFFYRKHGQSLINTAISMHKENRTYMLNKYKNVYKWNNYPQDLTS